jgi:hypothetical protein
VIIAQTHMSRKKKTETRASEERSEAMSSRNVTMPL